LLTLRRRGDRTQAGSGGAIMSVREHCTDAYRGFEEQRLAMNSLASELGVPISALPTGQGLLIKPA
jgi:hypothetical protein